MSRSNQEKSGEEAIERRNTGELRRNDPQAIFPNADGPPDVSKEHPRLWPVDGAAGQCSPMAARTASSVAGSGIGRLARRLSTPSILPSW
jgi:hypothetical protein